MQSAQQQSSTLLLSKLSFCSLILFHLSRSDYKQAHKFYDIYEFNNPYSPFAAWSFTENPHLNSHTRTQTH